MSNGITEKEQLLRLPLRSLQHRLYISFLQGRNFMSCLTAYTEDMHYGKVEHRRGCTVNFFSSGTQYLHLLYIYLYIYTYMCNDTSNVIFLTCRHYKNIFRKWYHASYIFSGIIGSLMNVHMPSECVRETRTYYTINKINSNLLVQL